MGNGLSYRDGTLIFGSEEVACKRFRHHQTGWKEKPNCRPLKGGCWSSKSKWFEGSSINKPKDDGWRPDGLKVIPLPLPVAEVPLF